MRRTVLALIVVLAGTAPASAVFLCGNSPPGESSLNTGIEQVAGELSRELLPGWSGAWLRGASEFFVAPSTIGGARGLAGLHNAENFVTGSMQIRNDTCGLYSVWNAIKDTASLPEGQFSKIALKLRQAIRAKGGLHEEELAQFISHLDESKLWAITKRAYSDLDLPQFLGRGAVIAHVDGNHWVRVIRVFKMDGKQWVHLFDSGRGEYYDQLLTSFMTRTGPNNALVILGTL